MACKQLLDAIWHESAATIDETDDNKRCCFFVTDWNVCIADPNVLPDVMVYITGKFMVIYEDASVFDLPITMSSGHITKIAEPGVVALNTRATANSNLHIVMMRPSLDFLNRVAKKQWSGVLDDDFFRRVLSRRQRPVLFAAHPRMFSYTATDKESNIYSGVMGLLAREQEKKAWAKAHPKESDKYPLAAYETGFLEEVRRTGGKQSWTYKAGEWSFNGEVQYNDGTTAKECDDAKKEAMSDV